MKPSKSSNPFETKPTRYGSLYGCCVCARMDAPMAFLVSTRYEATLKRCFQLTERRSGDICGYCARKVRRWINEEAIAAAAASGAGGSGLSGSVGVPSTSALSSTLAVPSTSAMSSLLAVPGPSAIPSTSAYWNGGADVVDFRTDANLVAAPQLPNWKAHSPLSWRTVEWPLAKLQPVRLIKKKNSMAAAASATVTGPGPSTSGRKNHPDKSNSFQPESLGIAKEIPRRGRPPKKKKVGPMKSVASVHPMNPDEFYSLQLELPGTAGEMPRQGCLPKKKQAGWKEAAAIRPMNADECSDSSYSSRSESPEIVNENLGQGHLSERYLGAEMLKARGLKHLPPPLAAFSDTRAEKWGPDLIQDSATSGLGPSSSSHGAQNIQDIENGPSTSRTDDCSSSGSELSKMDVVSSPSRDYD